MAKYKCFKCGKEYETSDVRFTAADKLTCVYCLGVKKREILPVHEKKTEDKPKEEMIEYQCGACNYSFKRKKGFLVSTCPYCNKEGHLVVKKSQDANKLINESTDKKYDF
jgi:DNA-directed RNA polymerase subunit RPC12/RpoP